MIITITTHEKGLVVRICDGDKTTVYRIPNEVLDEIVKHINNENKKMD